MTASTLGISRWRATVLVLLAALVAIVGALPAVPTARAQGTDPCPEAFPIDQLRRGMTATGWTVVAGDRPEPFAVEILGVLENGIAPGRDLIVVDTSGPAIDRAGGIWFGMSGSPVFIGDRLVGAVAFGLSFGPSSIGGLTAGQDLLDLVDPVAGTAGYAAAGEPRPERDEVPVTGATAEAIAERDARYASQQPSLSRLRLPLTVSGLAGGRMSTLQDELDERGAGVVAHQAGVLAGGFASHSADPERGGNFAGVLSVGDLEAAGVGTTTLVCNGQIVAFGHPFFFAGPTRMGASNADAITIVDDPNFGPFKLATITNSFGTLDQDRLAGVHAIVGAAPPSAPITSAVASLGNARSRDGRTDVVFPSFVPLLGAFHLLGNLDATVDRIGQGTGELSVVARGVRETGGTWSYRRDNVFASDFDISFEMIFEHLFHLEQLLFNPFEAVEITAIDYVAEVRDPVERYEIAEVLVSVDGGEPTPVDPFAGPVFAEPGAVLDLAVRLRGRANESEEVAELSLTVPEEAFGSGFLTVQGGDQSFFFFGLGGEPCFEPGCPDQVESFDELLANLESRPTNNEIVAELAFFADGPPGEEPPAPEPEPTEEPAPEPPPEEPAPGEPEPGQGGGEEPESPPIVDPGPGGGPLLVTARTTVDRVVRGGVSTEVFLDGGQFVIERVAGADRIETAVALSQLARPEPGTAGAVVVATAADYPDALAGAPLAVQLGAPVLLTAPDALPASVAEEIARLGATHAVILGGTGAVSDQVAAELEAAGIATVERIAGATRYATAAAVAARLGGPHAYVAQGADADPSRGWPDAVAVSGLAAFEAAPILLVERDRVPDETRAHLDAAGYASATIVGGTASVSDAVAVAIADGGVAVDRLAGANRYETSVAVAFRALEVGVDFRRTTFATGRAFPDALVAGPAAAADGGVLVLLDGEDLRGSPAVFDWVDLMAGDFAYARFVGGPAAIRDEVIFEIADRLFFSGPSPEPSPVAPPPPPE